MVSVFCMWEGHETLKPEGGIHILSPGTYELLSLVDKNVEDVNRLWILRWGIFFFFMISVDPKCNHKSLIRMR